MNKYDYHDYKLPNKEPLPSDINQIAWDIEKKLDPTGEFGTLMEYPEKNKAFGNLNFINPESGRLEAIFEYHSGMVKLIKLVKYLSKTSSSHFTQTIKNNKIDFRKIK